MRKGIRLYGSAQDVITSPSQISFAAFKELRNSVAQSTSTKSDAFWRCNRSKESMPQTFEERHLQAQGQSTIGASVVSAGAYISGWISSMTAGTAQ
jgi:hypothetical protein